MSHFARIDTNNIVQEVLVIEQQAIDTGRWGNPKEWIQTSYNTRAGEHLLGGTPLRKNYAGIGYTYDAIRDAFIPPKPAASWLLDEQTCQWHPPVPVPADPDNKYIWNEEIQNWIKT